MAIDLLGADVFGSRINVTLNTPLETYCDDLKTDIIRFSEFCLFPSQDDLAPICAIQENEPPDFIFNKLQSGGITTLDHLPVLWESALPLGTNTTDEWVPVETLNVSPAQILPTLQPITFDGQFEMSTNKIFMGSITSPGTATSYRMSNVTDQLLYPIILPSGASTKLGPGPLMTISEDGNVRVIGPYVWTTFTNKWTIVPEIEVYSQINGLKTIKSGNATYVIWFGSVNTNNTPCCIDIFLTSNAMSAELALFSHFDLVDAIANGQKGFLTVQSNYFIYCIATTANAGGYLNAVYASLITTPTTIAFALPLDSYIEYADNRQDSAKIAFLTAGCFGFAPGSTEFCLILGNPFNIRSIITFRWNASSVITYRDYFRVITGQVASSPNGEFISYVNGTEVQFVVLVRNGVSTYAPNYLTTPGQQNLQNTYVSISSTPFSSTSSVILTSTNSLLYYSNIDHDPANPNPGTWNAFPTYTSFIPVNDLGSSTIGDELYNPGPKWFFGKAPKLNILGVGAQSKHNRYRVKVTKVDATFPVPIQTVLYRHNDYYSLQHANEIRLYDNGNVQALTSTTVVWETAMSDGFGSSVDFVVVNKVRPSVSSNGNYLVYWTEGKTFRQCYYPYNSARFTEYCKFNATGFRNAINQQANFCFLNLALNPASPTNITFADGRCTCIGGERLFNALFVNTQDMLPAQKSVLLDYQPCMMVDCTNSRTNADPTNTARLVLLEGKCTTEIVICSTNLRVEDSGSIGNIVIDQNCGGGNLPLPTCTVDTDCPIGTVCIDGKCQVSCTSTESCVKSGYTNHTCVNGACVANSSAALSVGIIAGISVGIIVAIVLVAVLCWYFLVYRKAKTKNKK